MNITAPTVRTHALPRPWIPLASLEASPISREFELRDAALLEQAAVICAESYKCKAKAFSATDDRFKVFTDIQKFGRGKGNVLWRVFSTPLMAVSYLFVAAMAAVPVMALFILGALTEAIVSGLTGHHFHRFWSLLLDLPLWLGWFGGVALCFGLFVGGLVGILPRLASGRAFGMVDAANDRAVVVFCGSIWWENLTINAMVWGYFFPVLGHAGFHRAWSSIRDEVQQWLGKISATGQITQIVFTGHSLGGALAQIAALDLAADVPINHVISMGSACIGGNGMRALYSQRKIGTAPDAFLLNRTRHLAYTDDFMPRIPPISLFCQVGRLHCLMKKGELIEGSEAGYGSGFLLLLANTVDTIRSSATTLGPKFLELATIVRNVWKRIWGPRHLPEFQSRSIGPALTRTPSSQQLGMPSQRDPQAQLNQGPQLQNSLSPELFVAKKVVDYTGGEKVTFMDIVGTLDNARRLAPGLANYLGHVLLPILASAVLAFAIFVTLLPIVTLAAMYYYFIAKAVTAMFARHGIENYRSALKSHATAKQQQTALNPRPFTSELWSKLRLPPHGKTELGLNTFLSNWSQTKPGGNPG